MNSSPANERDRDDVAIALARLWRESFRIITIVVVKKAKNEKKSRGGALSQSQNCIRLKRRINEARLSGNNYSESPLAKAR